MNLAIDQKSQDLALPSKRASLCSADYMKLKESKTQLDSLRIRIGNLIDLPKTKPNIIKKDQIHTMPSLADLLGASIELQLIQKAISDHIQVITNAQLSCQARLIKSSAEPRIKTHTLKVINNEVNAQRTEFLKFENIVEQMINPRPPVHSPTTMNSPKIASFNYLSPPLNLETESFQSKPIEYSFNEIVVNFIIVSILTTLIYFKVQKCRKKRS